HHDLNRAPALRQRRAHRPPDARLGVERRDADADEGWTRHASRLSPRRCRAPLTPTSRLRQAGTLPPGRRMPLPIFYINLAARRDRREFMESQLRAMGMAAVRIEAVT